METQTKAEMIAILEQAGIEDAERLVSNWTYAGRAKNVSEIMRLWIDDANTKMQRFIVPYTWAGVGMDVYDVHALMGYILKLSMIGIMPTPMKEKQIPV